MVSFLEYASKYEYTQNEALAAFSSALTKQIAAFEKGEFTRRSWVKKDEGDTYVLKLGKLEKRYIFPEKKDVSEFLKKAAFAVASDTEFQALIEKAYGSSVEEPVKRRGRKPRGGDVVGNG